MCGDHQDVLGEVTAQERVRYWQLRLKPGAMLAPRLSPKLGWAIVVRARVRLFPADWLHLDVDVLCNDRLQVISQSLDSFHAAWILLDDC